MFRNSPIFTYKNASVNETLLEQAPTRTEKPLKPSGNRLRILVLDDEPLVLSGVSMLLQTLGHIVTESVTGEDVIRLITDGKHFDVAILDVRVQNGLGALDIVSQLTALDCSMKTVVSSGSGTDDVMVNYSDHGFSDSLPKPFTMKDLSSLIERLMAE